MEVPQSEGITQYTSTWERLVPNNPYSGESCSKGECLWLHKRSTVRTSRYGEGSRSSDLWTEFASIRMHLFRWVSLTYELKSQCMISGNHSTQGLHSTWIPIPQPIGNINECNLTKILNPKLGKLVTLVHIYNLEKWAGSLGKKAVRLWIAWANKILSKPMKESTCL